jgi:2'-5' RNA ligase
MSARLFVAVEVGEEDRLALAAWGAQAVGADGGMRVVDPAQIHLTLAFLGHRPLDEIEPLSALVTNRDASAPPALRTAGALWLSPRRPHVLTVALDDASDGLASIHADVLDALVRGAGHEAEPRRFRPHVTVARVRGRLRPFELPAPPELKFTPPAVTLYRSVLGRGPATYEPMASVPLSTLP